MAITDSQSQLIYLALDHGHVKSTQLAAWKTMSDTDLQASLVALATGIKTNVLVLKSVYDQIVALGF